MSKRNQISTLLGNSSSSAGETRRVLSAGGSSDSSYVSLGQALTSTGEAFAQLESAAQAQAASMVAMKQANSTSNSGSSGGSLATSLAESMLGGFGLSPILTGLLSLFGGGGGSSAPAPLPKYAAPYSISMEGVLTDGATGVVAADYGQNGLPRAVTSSGSGSAPSQVTVNVQAMDSQSILDRSDDIARAVKRAMLESSSLNDVVAEV